MGWETRVLGFGDDASGAALGASKEAQLQRAKEMGFDTDTVYYHGTADDIRAFDPDKLQTRDEGYIGTGVYTTPAPRVAGIYANTAKPSETVNGGYSGPNIMPLYQEKGNIKRYSLTEKADNASKMKSGQMTSQDLTNDLMKQGYTGAEVVDGAGNVVERATFNPSRVRSVNAAFDPNKAGSADLMALNSKKKLSTNPLDYINPQAIPQDTTQPEMRPVNWDDMTWSERVNDALYPRLESAGIDKRLARKLSGDAGTALSLIGIGGAMDMADFMAGKGDAVSAALSLLDFIPGIGKGVSSAAKGIVSTVENIGKGNKASPEELLRLGLLRADKAPTEKMIQNAQEKFKDLYAKPFYREVVEGARANNYETVFNKDMDVQHQIIQPEDLLGKSIVNYKSDLSDLGNVQKFDGVDTNVDVQSGTLFTPKNADQDVAWASMGSDTGKSGIANKAHEKAIQTENLTDKQVVAASHIMGPQSSSFSTPVAELMLAKIQNMNLPPDLIKKFDNAMKKVKPDWVGLNSDYALAQLKGKEGFSMEGAGAERKRFLQVLSMPQFRDAGLPQPDTTFPVIDNPDYKDLPYGMTGVNFWLPDTSKGVYKSDLHGSYSHVLPSIPGLMGKFEAPVRFDTLNKDAFDELATEMSKPVISKRTGKPTISKPYTYDQKVNANTTRSAGAKGTLQTIGEEDIERITKAIKHNKMLIAKYGTLGAALLAGEAIADEGQATDQ